MLELDEPPTRLECFDVSHTAGEATVASCVVFGPEGPLKSDYRRFNVADVAPGDDYGAMAQVLTRRYARVQQGEVPMPDVLFIDGGPGQLARAIGVLQELKISGARLVGVAKGQDRKPGRESLYMPDRTDPLRLPPSSPALHLIQQLRDEAHRFAITGHRARRQKARTRSPLEDIPGIGPEEAPRVAEAVRRAAGADACRDRRLAASEGDFSAARRGDLRAVPRRLTAEEDEVQSAECTDLVSSRGDSARRRRVLRAGAVRLAGGMGAARIGAACSGSRGSRTTSTAISRGAWV